MSVCPKCEADRKAWEVLAPTIEANPTLLAVAKTLGLTAWAPSTAPTPPEGGTR